jgi:hypothetical protein
VYIVSPIATFCKLKDAVEDTVGGFVGTGPFPPAFHDPSVVAINDDVFAQA